MRSSELSGIPGFTERDVTDETAIDAAAVVSRHRGRGRGPGRRGDRGVTLVEIVMTITLIGTTIVTILSAMTGAVASSSRARSVSQVNTVLQNAADRVNRAPKRCDYSVYAQAAALTQGWEGDQAIVTHEHLVPGGTAAVPGTWVSGACPGGTPTELLVQLVTVTVTSPDGLVTRSIEVVKSDV